MTNKESLGGFGLLTGIGLGAALMYFLDPQQGRRRRAIIRDQANSPSVQSSLDALAAAQAALQKATLAHLFEMAAALDPPDRQKLIQWTHDSLQPNPQ